MRAGRQRLHCHRLPAALLNHSPTGAAAMQWACWTWADWCAPSRS